jgi:ethanolamine-phosphate cytidylyltransferase
MAEEDIPKPGCWPIDPQEDEPEVLESRIWVDGCFDFAHHGNNTL